MLFAQVLCNSGLEIDGSGASTPVTRRHHAGTARVMDRAIAGALQLDIDRIPLTEVTDARQREQHAREAVLIPYG